MACGLLIFLVSKVISKLFEFLKKILLHAYRFVLECLINSFNLKTKNWQFIRLF